MTRLLAIVLLVVSCGAPPQPAPPRPVRCPTPRPAGLPPEPRHELDELEDALRDYARLYGGFPIATIDTTARTCPALVDPAAWQASPWKELRFRPRSGHRFYYAYDSDGNVATIVATADSDCDGKDFLVYTTVGDMNYGALTFTHSRPPLED